MSMKIIHDENLPLRLKKPFEDAVVLANEISESLANTIINGFNENKEFSDFSYSDTMTYIIKIHNIIFGNGLMLAHYIGSHFPDTENNAHELFEEAIKGLKIIINIKDTNPLEYSNGIKKLKAGD